MAELSAVPNSDAELLVLTAAGNADAFGEFYDRFERELLAFLVRATGRAELAADLCAEVFAEALFSVARFRPELGSARAWLYGIARHELADAWQHGRVRDLARRRLEIEALVAGIWADYQPNVVRGSTWDGLLSLSNEGTTPLCPGIYRLSVSVLDRGIFGEYGGGVGQLRKPFGSTTFTIH